MNKHNSQDFHDLEYDDIDGYDAVVVGSGYGGSVAACRLSMAGFKVCLLEKGKRWEAQDFPRNSLETLSAVRMENGNLGLNFGPKDALFQIRIQDDSLAATACSLGGGSLVNAGVMLRTSAHARRDGKWPKAWEENWEKYEASASDMLKIHTVPTKFKNSAIMEGFIGEEYDKNIHNPLKLSMNFDIEEHVSESRMSQETGNCLGCGNCLAGCPYNAKNSTDKTYLASAIKAGCTIKTESEVQYVVKNEDKENGVGLKRTSSRQWLVFLNEFDYIASDIVVLSAGVFGTADIIFQSRMRGLTVSEKLGSGLSCNGNNVVYIAGSSAELNAYGLKRKQFSDIPLRERPGPSISSSYISSLGFTIQSAVIPTAYPSFLFKGITTYACQSGHWFLRRMIIDSLKHVLCLNRGQEMILNVMGHDDSSGKITFDKDTNKIFFQPPHDFLLPQKIKAFHKLAKKLGGRLFMSRYRSTSVHLLGGCIASSDVSSGVCNPNGQVFVTKSPSGVHPGLHICDASIIPCSVGINPCLTIAAAAEHISRKLTENEGCNQKHGLISHNKMKKRLNFDVAIKETMRGQVGGMLCAAYFKLRLETQLPPGKVGGCIECKGIEMDRMYIIHGEVDLCKTDTRTPYTQYMHYNLLIAASSGSRYALEGKKIMNPYLLALYAWRESTTLNVTLRKITKNIGEKMTNLKGKLHISPLELLKSMCSLEGGSRSKFIVLLMQSLLRTYILQVPRGSHIKFTHSELAHGSYPNSTVHEIRTESCCLPTERNDLIRTLLKAEHDVWLLHTRLHPPNCSDDFSIEDIGRMDIVAAINKIILFYKESVRLHVVAHCVGGLAIHIALMGGHVSARHIASLSCTNSSMFFKLTTFSLFKMQLPLIPISMAIMGKNKTLPLLQKSPTSFRHRLLKSIARLIPRYERCTCNECEVFSGIFGNTFWHENVTQSVHHWMNKEYLTRLPMAAFHHLRKICNNGFIVDARGNNSYLIHPERMALPTLYISGGRTLLVTRETSFLANKYVKLHQPGYRHERVVVDGFGHSDLLIGEKSEEEVFPHIVKHIELTEEEEEEEEERSSCRSPREYKYMKEAMAWSDDPYEEDRGRFGGWILILITVILLVVLLK